MDQTNVGLVAHLVHWIVSAIAVLITAYFVRGFKVSGFVSALIAAVVIGLVNMIIWPILFFLTIPINILTLGLFTFIINGACIKIAAAVLPGFEVKSWGAAIFGAIVLSLVGTGLHYIFI